MMSLCETGDSLVVRWKVITATPFTERDSFAMLLRETHLLTGSIGPIFPQITERLNTGLSHVGTPIAVIDVKVVHEIRLREIGHLPLYQRINVALEIWPAQKNQRARILGANGSNQSILTTLPGLRTNVMHLVPAIIKHRRVVGIDLRNTAPHGQRRLNVLTRCRFLLYLWITGIERQVF